MVTPNDTNDTNGYGNGYVNGNNNIESNSLVYLRAQILDDWRFLQPGHNIILIISWDQRGYEALVGRVVDSHDRSILRASGPRESIELALRVLLDLTAQTVSRGLHPMRDIYGMIRSPNGEDRIGPGP